jgi:hypothetical protein
MRAIPTTCAFPFDRSRNGPPPSVAGIRRDEHGKPLQVLQRSGPRRMIVPSTGASKRIRPRGS